MDDTFWGYCALVALAAFTVVTWVFIVRYFKLGSWKLTREGRNLLFMKISLGVLAATIFIFRFWIDEPEYYGFRAFVYSVIFAAMTYFMVKFNSYLVVEELAEEIATKVVEKTEDNK
jgi:hypothetical protein